MEFLKYGSLVILFYFFMLINISASTVQYNDLVAPEDYKISKDDFSDIKLQVNSNSVDINNVDINSIGNDKYNLSFSDGNFSFDAIIQIQRVNYVTNVQAGQNHYLEIKDENAIVTSQAQDVYCNVISDVSETVTVSAQTANEAGVNEGTIKCDSLYIDTNSVVNTVTTNEYSKYAIDQNNVLYAQDFAYGEDIVNLTDKEVIERAKVESTFSNNINVISRNRESITFNDGLLNLTIEILDDEVPKLNVQDYYEIQLGDDISYESLFDVTDDFDDTFEYDSTIDTSEAGIFLETISIRDSVNNVTNEEVLVLINDGSYKVTSNGRYIYQSNELEVSSSQDYITVTLYDIKEKQYVDMDIKIFNKQSDEKLNVIKDEDINNIYKETKESMEDVDSYTNIYIIIAVIVLIIIGFLI